MKIEGTIYCEGPDCETHQHTPALPIVQVGGGQLHFGAPQGVCVTYPDVRGWRPLTNEELDRIQSAVDTARRWVTDG